MTTGSPRMMAAPPQAVPALQEVVREDGAKGSDAGDSRSRDCEARQKGQGKPRAAAVADQNDAAGGGPRLAIKRGPKRVASPARPENGAEPDSVERLPRKQRKEIAAAALEPGVEPQANGSSSATAVTASSAPIPTADGEGSPAASMVVLDGGKLEMQRLQCELDAMREQCSSYRRRLHSAGEKLKLDKQGLSHMLVQLARQDDADERDRVEVAHFQLGRCRQSTIPGVGSSWEGGYEAEEIAREKDRIKEDKQAIERLRRSIPKKPKRSSTKENSGGNHITAGGATSSTASAGLPAATPSVTSSPAEETAGVEDTDDLWETREIYNYRMFCLTREEVALKERETRLAADRMLHAKRLQRLEVADRSTFRNYPLVGQHSRYQLLNMIGRGGFSEVYRAYDLENNQYCACKIHELSADMNDQQRQSYIRRAMREYEIQKGLKHARVVALLDCFPISTKAFGTVLELCEGDTLDEYIKRHGALPEKEARGVVIQMFSGLKYMNTNGRKIIHYDIKPGNIFFRGGEVKIADFGLSKVVHDDNADQCPSIELTSVGAGTYWYLPPECISPSQDNPTRISNKVDVWSTGVVFFEMLFRRKPFGHGQQQDALVRSVICGGVSFEVEIPSTPKVTTDAKEFMKRLLRVEREKRPDVIEAYNDPYLRPPRSRNSVAASNAGSTSSPAAAPSQPSVTPPPTASLTSTITTSSRVASSPTPAPAQAQEPMPAPAVPRAAETPAKGRGNEPGGGPADDDEADDEEPGDGPNGARGVGAAVAQGGSIQLVNSPAPSD